MRHLKNTKKLGRDRAQRKALKKMLASSLILHGKIQTTEAKASFVRPYIEKIITACREKSLISKRALNQDLNSKAAIKFSKDLAIKFAGKKGGYTRITKLFTRKGDNAKMVLLELIQ
ncbi:MAG: 50S ribosomal protein L17 [Patescibacteria group bacterium]|jgi:large subunit ribosomal protein L17